MYNGVRAAGIMVPLRHIVISAMNGTHMVHVGQANQGQRMFASVSTRGRTSLHRRRHNGVSMRARGRKALQELLDEKEEDDDVEEGPVLKESVAWESPLCIAQYPDPVLRAKNATIECFDDSLRKLAEEMFEIMYECVTMTRWHESDR